MDASTQISMIPAAVLRNVEYSLNALRQIEQSLTDGRNLDRRFGGEGRYEAETWEKVSAAVTRHADLLTEFCTCAAGMGIEGRAVLAHLGGQAVPMLSAEGQAWIDDQIG